MNGPGVPPSLTNDAGTGCIGAGPTSFTGLQLSYWSSTAASGAPDGNPDKAWLINIGGPGYPPAVYPDQKTQTFQMSVWPVRGGR
jgi:hypothetical protein